MTQAHDHDHASEGLGDHDHGDDHRHGHDHGHGHFGHVHAPASFGRRFALGVSLNIAFVVIEAVFGILGNSIALLADAGHNLSDALGLGVAWTAFALSRREPTSRFTYGLGGTSILAALFNGVLLLVVTGGLTWEAITRFFEPQPVSGKTVMAVAACGILLNGFCAWLFASGRKSDLNMRGAFLHMAADALVSLGVVIGGLAIVLTGRQWIDPLVSLVINGVIVWGTWSLLTGSLAMSLSAVPSNIDLAKVRAFLCGLPGVASVHDLHVWSLSTTETALTCHVVMPGGHPGDEALAFFAKELEAHFGISHATLQTELEEPSGEHLAGCHG